MYKTYLIKILYLLCSDVVKVTSAMLDKTEVKVLEDGGVTAVVGDQTFSQSTPQSPPDPTKESTPYIPNVPKV